MIYTCATCANAFPASPALYAAIGETLPTNCLLCRMLAKQRKPFSAEDDRTLFGTPTRTPYAQRSTLAGPRGEWTREHIMTAIHAWCLAHDGRFPTNDECDTDPLLPSAPTIRRQYQSFDTCVMAFRRQYPGLGWRYRDLQWSEERILDVLAAWLQAHPGETLLSTDLEYHSALPTHNIIYHHIGKLKTVYAALESRVPGCLALYQQRLDALQRENGERGRKQRWAHKRKAVA